MFEMGLGQYFGNILIGVVREFFVKIIHEPLIIEVHGPLICYGLSSVPLHPPHSDYLPHFFTLPYRLLFLSFGRPPI